ncbi:hypothetical protein BS47DRAFT_1340507 [Hydnum rufescens UP504]|uniref:Uncharacterized protein n=1 Tax=Hydnum rufescens UP504 TaxID=1448309 RepID=A0A9P6B370_9AGAM|nr:hypothetical protein BS47DRAFT_1340507 [Hydnum rufescens UP504]
MSARFTSQRPHTKSSKVPQPPPPGGWQALEEQSAKKMLAEIAHEEAFLKSEEIRLAHREERLNELRRRHEQWIVYRVRKELAQIQEWRESERLWNEAEAARLAAEERLRAAEETRERLERELKEERERAARTKAQNQQNGGRQYEWQKFARGAYAQPTPAPQGWDNEARRDREGWESYVSRWKFLSSSASSSKTSRLLLFGDIPWPIYSTRGFKPHEITKERVGRFILSRFHSTDKSPRERLRSALILWHPDKFDTKWLPRVDPSEQALVKEGVSAVVRALNELMVENR